MNASNLNTPKVLRALYKVGEAVGGAAPANKQAVTGFLEQYYSAADFAEFNALFMPKNLGMKIATKGDAPTGTEPGLQPRPDGAPCTPRTPLAPSNPPSPVQASLRAPRRCWTPSTCRRWAPRSPPSSGATRAAPRAPSRTSPSSSGSKTSAAYLPPSDPTPHPTLLPTPTAAPLPGPSVAGVCDG